MANFTKQAIKRSFIKLLDEQPLSKISVRDIVEDCGINRNSFYYHYQDIPSLLCEVITEEAEQIIEKYPTPDSIESCVEACIEFMLSHKKAALHVFNSGNKDFYEQTLDRLCTSLIASYFDKLFGELPIDSSDRELIIKISSAEYFGVMIKWMMQGMNDDIFDDFHRICELRRGMVEEMIKRAVNK